jgi:guanyl-specific ribonuclease Sa
LSVDPLVDETGQPYAYTGDDPINALDPSGLGLIPSWLSSAVSSVEHGAIGVGECLENYDCFSPKGLANVAAGFANGATQIADGAICSLSAEQTCPSWSVGAPFPCDSPGSYQVGELGLLAVGFLLPGGDESDLASDLAPALEEGSQVPQTAQEVLEYVETHNGNAPPGFQGGGTFYNNEGLLPSEESGQAITYREYDVNPYEKGVNRGPERIVVGSNGSAYYTSDHYQSFVPIG